MNKIVQDEKKPKNLRYQRDRDREKVRGRFIFNEVPNGQMEFVYRAYKEDPIERYCLKDGEIYEIPLGVARHLNKNGWYPIHRYLLNDQGAPAQLVNQKVRRFSFQSLEFMDSEEIGDNHVDIVTVKNL